MSSFTHQDGNTALHMASMDHEYNRHKINCIKALLSHPDIDVDIKNNEGRTAMMVHVYVY